MIKQILNLYKENIVCKCEKLTDSDTDEEEKQNVAPDISQPKDAARKNSEPSKSKSTQMINPKKSVPSNILDIKASLMADDGDKNMGLIPEERKDSVRSFIDAVNLSNRDDKEKL